VDDVLERLFGYHAYCGPKRTTRGNKAQEIAPVNAVISRARYSAAHADFERARRRAVLYSWLATLSRQSRCLRAFADATRALSITGQHYRGMQQVPISSIVGTVDRAHDFDRNFMPSRAHTRVRWERIALATAAEQTLPPVELYKLGDEYYVKDGNHRVSVARFNGTQYVDAQVVEYVASRPELATADEPRQGDPFRTLETAGERLQAAIALLHRGKIAHEPCECTACNCAA
jgi:hypothetical protein